jgi:signal transduction histidine kinase
LNTYLALAAQPNWDAFCQRITSAFAHAYGVDICLFFSPVASNQRVACECGFNAHTGETIPRFSVSDADIPHLLDALAAGSAVALDRAHHFDDFVTLESAIGLPECGTLFVQPVVDESAKALAALVFLSPFSQAVLSPQDHAYLQAGSLQMARLLHHTIGNFVLKQELRGARQEVLAAKADQGGLFAENRMLREEIAKTQSYQPDRYQDDESLDELLSAHEEAQKIISRLRVENIRLLGLLKLAGAGELSEVPAGELLGATTVGEDHMPEIDEELRVALLEVAHLQSVIEEADRSILDLRRQREFEKLSLKNQEQVFTLTRDLRQSLSAILGYSDFLLDESIGILGSLQRKFLERVKSSAERMSTQVDEIIAITNSEIVQLQRSPDHTDIYAAVDTALTVAGQDLRQKEISLRVDLGDGLPELRLDTEQIERCLGILLSNAGSVTPAQGEISLKVAVDHEDSPGDHVLFQVADQGAGIAPELLPSLFTQPASSDLTQLDRVSVDLASLVELQAIVSELHGRLWVDSTLGTGSVFSVLIPVYLDELASPENE